MKRTYLAGIALGLAPLALSACGSEAEVEAPEGPVEMRGVEISNARLILPAVGGNPGVVYFDLAFDGERNVQLRAVSVAGAASATMHEYIEWNGGSEMGELIPQVIAPGATLSFEPGGKHIMAMELADELEAGTTTQVTLSFSGGSSYTFDAEIREPGDDR